MDIELAFTFLNYHYYGLSSVDQTICIFDPARSFVETWMFWSPAYSCMISGKYCSSLIVTRRGSSAPAIHFSRPAPNLK